MNAEKLTENCILQIIFFNARSVVNKINSTHNLISSGKYDIIFVSETWLTKSVYDSMLCPSQYSIYRRDHKSGRGGGVMVLFIFNLHISQIHSSLYDDDIESITVDVHGVNNKLIPLSCWYVPPWFTSHVENMVRLCNCIQSIQPNLSPFHVFGDFNHPNIEWSIPSNCGGAGHQNFLDFCIENLLTQNILHRPIAVVMY